MERERVYFGVVGVGNIGKRHIAMIEADAETELVAVCDVRSAEACGLTSGVPFYSTIAEMLASHPEIEVVSVCTPNGMHAQMTVELLHSDKSVVLEKPTALTVEDSRAIMEAEKASKGQVFCVFQNRYTPTSVWIKEVVESGTLGELRQVIVNCMWNRDERYYKENHWHGTADMDGGTLFTQYSHHIDILLWLCGEIEIVGAQFDDFCHQETTDFEDTGAILFRTKGGAIGSFTYTTAIPLANYECSILLIGSKGSVKIGGQYMSDVEHCNIEGYTMPHLAPANKPNDYGEYKGSAANHCYVIRNVAEALLHGSAPFATLADGDLVLRTILDIYKLRTKSYKSAKQLSYKPC